MEGGLRAATAKSVPLFSLNGYVTLAKLVSNYDGDTGDVIFPYNGQLMHMKARFNGYDTCEIKPSKSDPDREMKKAKAIAARKRLWHLCTQTTTEPGADHTGLMLIKCGEFDKYGRLLVMAFPHTTSINEKMDDQTLFAMSINKQMIDEGHGYVYTGGTKSVTFGGRHGSDIVV